MEISLLKVFLNNLSSYFHLSSHENINHEPAQKYYQKIEEILKLLKPVLEAVFDGDIMFEEPLPKAFADLGHSVNELRMLFENWHSLGSKINFVLQVESLIPKVRASGVEILELLKYLHQRLPVELSASSLEILVHKIKQMGSEQTSAIIGKTISEQVDGTGPSSENLEKFADCLSLRSNQELLIEAVALEKLKENAEQAENNGEAEYFDQMIALVTHMHERLVVMKQSQGTNPVPIPADFCCPLSLELMTDPVIVASGQTYERAFIRKWIDLGLTVCPKTRQTLAHTNLIPNYTVKALIANWCESNNVKLPDPMKSMSLNQPSSLARAENVTPRDLHTHPHSRSHQPMSPESTRSTGSPGRNLVSSSGIHREGTQSHPRSSSESSLPAVAENGHGLDIARLLLTSSEDGPANSVERSLESGSQSPTSPSTAEYLSASGVDERLSQGHNRTASASSTVSNANMSQGMLADGNEASSHVTAYNSDASGELTSESQASATLTTPHREPDFSPRLEVRTRNQTMWRRPSDRFVPRIVSSPAIDTRADLSGVEAQVRKLVEDLKSTSLDAQRDATAELRLLAKHNMDNRIVIASCGAMSLLVNLLSSNDAKIQENAVTALLNLSINDNNKTAIANAGAIEPLIHVLETGSPEAKENSAATLFSLSVIEDNKVRIGRSGAIKPLVDLLGNGTPRGKKDAATALFNLSIFHENKARIVQAGAVKHLVELMDPAAGMVDKAVAVLANLATIQDGRTAIGQEGGIPVLVEVVELGSTRGKENAAAALLQLSTNSNRFCSMVLQEGAVPPLVALSQSGTPRAKEKAQALLSYFRNQRHGNAGRG
ncbi:U-box domain-containing protein 4-like [Actinidia eriantha]|uniref:U-box domain-containing protein 4-like n=1 Tax=Actinidia eriantha TaxID=165200 RepID=UPI0025843B43|nr:U-box domain-containing protein 4-like [Actinidia eriantha]XP_057491723.1 U-box domain-containing protein 4-like [Actinidia eriantha]XP_057491724.1 U-box domain-containing protein 4-like [Actinidia eriantha]